MARFMVSASTFSPKAGNLHYSYLVKLPPGRSCLRAEPADTKTCCHNTAFFCDQLISINHNVQAISSTQDGCECGIQLVLLMPYRVFQYQRPSREKNSRRIMCSWSRLPSTRCGPASPFPTIQNS